MKIVTLLENTAVDGSFAAEHGLSLYMETGDHKILFDAGQTDGFAANAEKLGIDLGAVDLAVLSHGHYDHGGGLSAFLERNSTAPVYLRREAFGPHYNARGKYIGLDPALAENPRLVFAREGQILADGISLHACNDRERPYPGDNFGLTVLEDGEYRPDSFCHEHYLLIEEAGKKYLFSGCSHKGILNIAAWFRPDVLVGGFHFKSLDPVRDRAFLTDAAQKLLELPTVYYTGHCTGQEQYAVMKEVMGHRLHSLHAGQVLEMG